MQNPRLFVIGGPSGSGKTTTARLLSEQMKNYIHYQNQLTTRYPRPSEVEDSPYEFVSKEEMKKLDSSKKLVVKTEFVNNVYAFDQKFYYELKEHLENGNSVVVDSIHPISEWKNFSERFPDVPVSTIFLSASKDVLKKRIESREKIDAEVLKMRLEHSSMILKDSKKYDFRVSTDDVSSIMNSLISIFEQSDYEGNENE